MWISRYVSLFMIYSMLGWLYETSFCTFKDGKWENRGFLYGPACPIYGFGAVAISIVMQQSSLKGIRLDTWMVFIISVIGSAILEYLTSLILEKLFHAVWWDYSDLPLNLHGRISLLTSLGFGVAGLVIVNYIAPVTEKAMDFLNPISTELLSLCLIFVFAVDLTLTVTALLHFDRFVIRMEDSFNRNMESIVDGTVQQSNRIKQGVAQRTAAVNDQISSMSSYVKNTVKRVKSFRGGDKKHENTRNRVLSIVKRIKISHNEENS